MGDWCCLPLKLQEICAKVTLNLKWYYSFQLGLILLICLILNLSQSSLSQSDTDNLTELSLSVPKSGMAAVPSSCKG